jgi:hypothetical protein
VEEGRSRRIRSAMKRKDTRKLIKIMNVKRRKNMGGGALICSSVTQHHIFNSLSYSIK